MKNLNKKKILYFAVLIIICIIAVRYLYSSDDAVTEFPTQTVEITASAVEAAAPETAAQETAAAEAAAEETAAEETEPLQLVTLAPEKEQLHFKNEERLLEHFEKHNEDFGYASAEEYEAGANAVIHNPKALSKLESEDGDYVYFLESTGEFVVVSPKKVIRTYYLADRDYFDRQ